MRYSMLVYLTKMCRTLMEAADYLDCAAQNDPACAQLLENGKVMLSQIETELVRHKEDLLSTRPAEYLDKLRTLWETGGSELSGTLGDFAQCLTKDVRYQVRAVFFTGLGSTWDAMESVYEYMRDDPRFDPVVVLIPIIRQREQDGEIKNEIIYEDYLTARKITFYEYSQYSLDEDCPEIAFINQPYEGTILSDFWPETIAKHTRLVYLPYFLPFLILAEQKETLCKLPVYRYAWKVIGASQSHYSFYRANALNGGGNMLVTGLPKLDPIVRLRDRQADIPKEWETALMGRKAVLWNTWYSYSFSSIAYFDAIIGWFQSHEDFVLIWRPHPMTDAVTKLHYSREIYEKLRKCIETVRGMSNAIYDEETSYSAAFSVSVAQMSDYSSMMSQYLLLDKPLLWIKNERHTGAFDRDKGKYIVDWRWMEEAEDSESVLSFLNRIYDGIDKKSDIRREICRRDLPLADGHCGERVCEQLWMLLHQEDEINLT